MYESLRAPLVPAWARAVTVLGAGPARQARGPARSMLAHLTLRPAPRPPLASCQQPSQPAGAGACTAGIAQGSAHAASSACARDMRPHATNVRAACGAPMQGAPRPSQRRGASRRRHAAGPPAPGACTPQPRRARACMAVDQGAIAHARGACKLGALPSAPWPVTLPMHVPHAPAARMHGGGGFVHWLHVGSSMQQSLRQQHPHLCMWRCAAVGLFRPSTRMSGSRTGALTVSETSTMPAV